ncbi:MAG: hypothetical protein PHV30_08515 [Candidatus Margulisbacteria bacterium]|nr:hypothetical protein [Candidatus Margulisiibacteriota bacterium]
MYVANPDFTQKNFQQNKASKAFISDDMPVFNNVLNQALQHQALDGVNSADNKNVRKKKKDTEEILEDYKEEMKNTYDVLELEKKIRKVFRKIKVQI